jgi:hypothetical protein
MLLPRLSYRIDLVPHSGMCEVGISCERFAWLVTGARQVADKSTNSEKAIEVCGGHGLHDSRRDLLVFHGFSAP